MAKTKFKNPAEFMWQSLNLSLKDPAPLQGISDLLDSSGYQSVHDIIMSYLAVYDKSNNGSISYKDFQAICSPDFDPFEHEETLAAIFAKFDRSESGAITKEDLIYVAREVNEPVTEEEAQNMINTFDLDRDGVIDAKEFRTIVKPSISFKK